MKRCRLLCILTWSLLGASACTLTPGHDVRVHPDYIRAGVQVGDRVEVTELDGSKHEFIVIEVANDALRGDGYRVEFADIGELRKYSWEPPAHPCGGGEPVGCSLPVVVRALSEYHNDYAQRFDPACVQHDFCYRHGYATYGTSREGCDESFYARMQQECGSVRFLDMLDVERTRRHTECKLAAEQFYLAVRRYGEEAYRTTGSTVCEYQ